ncbi:MAG: dipeptide epimerase [Caulobacterales bacterium]|nr:dipeptide epimerase [Caulobacterales bacterium]
MSFAWTVLRQCWRTAGTFRISRGARIHVEVLELQIAADGHEGRAECVPYARYGETLDSAADAIDAFFRGRTEPPSREAARAGMPAGAARNAVDCALWDLEAKSRGAPVWRLAGEREPAPLLTAFTISVDAPEAMAGAARAAGAWPFLKLKLAGEGDLDRVGAVRAARPDARLMIDANEAWSAEQLRAWTPEMARMGVEAIEQPLPAGQDEGARAGSEVALCADESAHDLSSLEALIGRYDMINIKLDKTGGLTEALALRDAARAQGLKVMVGCMLATSLAMAPAVLAAQGADIADLDGPLLLNVDRPHALGFDGPRLRPPTSQLWG